MIPFPDATDDGHAIVVDGVNVHCEVHGQGEPLVLLHAGTLTGDMWNPFLSAFAERYRVIVPDLRGHGRSDNPKGAMAYREFADEMVALIRALDIERPLIAGFSDGGQVALEIGMRYPNVPRALIVGGAWFKFSDTYRAWVRGVLGPEDTPGVDLVRFEQNHPEWAAHLKQQYGSARLKTLLADINPMWTTPLNYSAEEFAQVVSPTLVLIGDRDELVPVEESVELYRLLPNAELAVVPGAVHGSFFSERVGFFQAAMLDFLRRYDGSA